jgi:hypothetical protein
VHCDAPLRLPEEFIGKDVRCPSCQKAFTARLPATASAPTSRSEPDDEPDEEQPSSRKPRDDDDRVARRRPREDDEEERPSRRRSRDDDEDDEDYPRSRRPRSRRRSYPKGDRSGVILALGIISVVFVLISCAGVAITGPIPLGIVGIGTGIAAWLMGRKDLEDMRNGQRDPNGEGMTNAGWICGMIGTIVNGLIVLIQCVIIALFAVLFLAAAGGAAAH